MKALTLEIKSKTTAKVPKEIKLSPIKDNDPFFASAPVNIGHTNNELIDKILYGTKCPK